MSIRYVLGIRSRKMKSQGNDKGKVSGKRPQKVSNLYLNMHKCAMAVLKSFNLAQVLHYKSKGSFEFSRRKAKALRSYYVIRKITLQ